jgi:hypothetical protein
MINHGHIVVGRLGCMMALAAGLALSACGPQNEGMDDAVEQSQHAITNDGYWMGTNGRMYSMVASLDGVQSYHIYNAASLGSWSTSNPQRYRIVDWSDWENIGARCGAEARSRYNAASGSKWCTEYARWILWISGLRDIRYCKIDFLGLCLEYVYLSGASTVSDMVGLFSANGGWIREGDITLDKIQPGDYIALTGSSGERKSHSGIVMSVAGNGRYIYTSEGNVGDCVHYMIRDLFVDGVLNPEIDGIGKANVAF